MAMQPVDRWANEAAGFNRQAADAVYSTVMKMHPDEAVMFTRMVADASLQNDLMVHGELIVKTATEVLSKRAELLKSHLARTAISKARNGQDATAELVALDAITKSWLGDMFSHAANQARARKRHRDLSNGQFAVEHHTITTNPSHPEGGAAPTPTDTPEKEAEWAALTPAQRSAYQQAYSQVSALVKPYMRAPAGSAFLHLRDESGDERMSPIPHGDNATLKPETIDRGGKRIVHASISFVPPENAQGGIMSMFNAIGMPRTGAVVAGSTERGALNADSLKTYRTDLNGAASDQQYPSNKVFRRMEASSKLITDTLGNAAPPQAKMALGLASHVGSIGPSVRDVVGPTLDRAAYRYRGTERRIDPKLITAIDNDHARASQLATTSSEAAKGMREADKTRERSLSMNKIGHDERIGEVRRFMAQSESDLRAGVIDRDGHRSRIKIAQRTVDDAAKRHREQDKKTLAAHKEATARFSQMAASGAKEHAKITSQIVARGYTTTSGDWKSGHTLNYFKRLVPDPDLNDLHLSAGNAPASQGIIIDSKGKVTTQAIGYGDDHFLPFPIKTMRAMRGGSYIRTRTWGGPTAEDIRTSLLGGASHLTVVSNSGVFHVDFDPDFTGGRRHNDKAYRMIGRYEHLLDAVKSGNVSRAGLAPSRLDELRAEAGGDGAPGFTSEFARLKANAIANPKLSKVQREEVAAEFLRDVAADRGAKGEDETTRSMINDIADRKSSEQHAALMARYQEDHRIYDRLRLDGNAIPDLQPPTGPPSKEVLRQAELERLRDPDPMVAMQNVADEIGKGPALTAALARAEAKNREDMKKLRLNGKGYALALAALHEQFPYYIASPPEYHPWSDNSPQREDTGYVRPGATRPGSAQFGFNDPNGPGGGKSRADTVRGQNQGVLLPATSLNGNDVTTTATAQAPATPAAPAAATPAPVSQAAAAVKVRAANRDMLNLLTGMTHFGPNAVMKVNGKDIPFDGQVIAEQVSKPGFPSELRPFVGSNVDKTALLNQLDGDPAKAAILVDKMQKAHDWLDARNALPDDPATAKTVAAFLGGGAPTPSASTRDVDAILSNPNRDFEFVDENPVLVKGRGVSQSDIQAAYARPGLVANLVTAGALPAQVGDSTFTAKANALHATLVANAAALQNYAINRVGAPPMHEGALKNATFGLATALQARRRWEDAGAVRDAADAEASAAKQAEWEAGQPARDAAKAQQAAAAGRMVFAGWKPETFDQYDDDPEFKAQVDENIRAAGKDPHDVIERERMKAMIDNAPADPTGQTFLGHAIIGNQNQRGLPR